MKSESSNVQNVALSSGRSPVKAKPSFSKCFSTSTFLCVGIYSPVRRCAPAARAAAATCASTASSTRRPRTRQAAQEVKQRAIASGDGESGPRMHRNHTATLVAWVACVAILSRSNWPFRGGGAQRSRATEHGRGWRRGRTALRTGGRTSESASFHSNCDGNAAPAQALGEHRLAVERNS